MTATRLEAAIREMVAALRDEVTPPPEPPALLSIDDAAHTLGIGRTRLYALMDDGSLPSLHVGKRRMVRRADVEAFIAARDD